MQPIKKEISKVLILNITSKVLHHIAKEWQKWTQDNWIPMMMKTGLFSSYRFCKLRDNDDDEGQMFVVQFHCDSEEDYHSFINEYDETIRNEAYKQFGNNFISFRTLMEVID
ncbi:MAG TPA: DUF4286 family protein [Edaphocola sp.]|nr:DUF4286 family protein [Edaphocola sp.]